MNKTTTIALAVATAFALVCVPLTANAAPSANSLTNTAGSLTNLTSLPSPASLLPSPSAAPTTPVLSGVGVTILPAQMSAPTATLNSDGTVTSTWGAPSDLVTALIGSFQLEELANGATVRVVTLPSSTTSYVSSVLSRGTTYATRIASVNTLGSGSASNPSNLVAITADPTVNTNMGSGASSTTTNGATTNTVDTTNTSTSIPSASPSEIPAALPPASVAPSPSSSAPISTPVTPAPRPSPTAVTTLPVPGVPTVPKITSIKVAGKALTISWKKSIASNSEVKQYTVKIYKGAKLVKSIVAPASRLWIKITKLSAHATYTVKILAKSKHGKISKYATKIVRIK